MIDNDIMTDPLNYIIFDFRPKCTYLNQLSYKRFIKAFLMPDTEQPLSRNCACNIGTLLSKLAFDGRASSC